MNFGGIDTENSAFENSDFVVIPVPYDLTSTYQAGSRNGPLAILEASCNMELYDEELRKEAYLAGICTLPFLEADASGPEKMAEKVRKEVADVLSCGKTPVILGGEHGITIGAVQAVKEKYPSVSVLQLDAHADMRESYQGTPYSHACVGRRIFEMCPVVQFGIRSMSVEEAVFIEKRGIKTFYPDFTETDSDWIGKIFENLSDDVYITIDIDVLDPSVMPSTGTPEPGGIYWKDLLRLLKEVSKNRRIIGFDVVELCPIPGMIAPDFTAAKLIYKLIGYISEKNDYLKGRGRGN